MLFSKQATALVNREFTGKLPRTGKGILLKLQDTLNTTVDQLGAMASELARVARETGTKGKLGGSFYIRGLRDILQCCNSCRYFN